MNNSQEDVSYVPNLSKATLNEIGVDSIETERPPVSDEELIVVLAVDGRADADAFDRSPELARLTRRTSERERKAFGLSPGAYVVVSRTSDGCIMTEYFG